MSSEPEFSGRHSGFAVGQEEGGQRIQGAASGTGVRYGLGYCMPPVVRPRRGSTTSCGGLMSSLTQLWCPGLKRTPGRKKILQCPCQKRTLGRKKPSTRESTEPPEEAKVEWRGPPHGVGLRLSGRAPSMLSQEVKDPVLRPEDFSGYLFRWPILRQPRENVMCAAGGFLFNQV